MGARLQSSNLKVDKIVRALLRMLRNTSGEGLGEGSHGCCLNYPTHVVLPTLGTNKESLNLKGLELSD